MASFKYYDFTLTSGGAAVLLVEGEYFRIQSATGAVDVTVEGAGTLPGLLVGQGLKDTPFKRLVIKDVSGGPNVGQIMVASKEFVDNRTYGVTTLSNTNGPFAQSASTVTNASAQLLAANANRRYFLIQNNDLSGDIFVTLDGAAATTARGIKVAAGGSFELSNFCPTGAVFAIGSIASNANVVIVSG